MDNENENPLMNEEELKKLEFGLGLAMNMSRAVYISAIKSGFNEHQALSIATSYFISMAGGENKK